MWRCWLPCLSLRTTSRHGILDCSAVRGKCDRLLLACPLQVALIVLNVLWFAAWERMLSSLCGLYRGFGNECVLRACELPNISQHMHAAILVWRQTAHRRGKSGGHVTMSQSSSVAQLEPPSCVQKRMCLSLLIVQVGSKPSSRQEWPTCEAQ